MDRWIGSLCLSYEIVVWMLTRAGSEYLKAKEVLLGDDGRW